MATEEEKVSTPHLEQLTPESLELLTPPTLTPREEARTWMKIDLRLMPILILLYLSSFLDRANIGLAKLQGLTEELKLTGNKYNIALTVFFIPYCLFEFPSNLVLKKFRPSRWLPGIAVLWGAVMVSMGFVKTYHQLVGARFCLGVAEAGLFPGVIYYLTLWYPRHRLQYRVGLFLGASSLSGAFSGLLAYGIGFMSGTAGKLGWSWIFILEGCGTVVVGVLAFFVMVDFPSTAKFLTPKEKNYLLWVKKYDTTSVGEEEHFEFRHIIMAVTDWQVWVHILLYWSIVGPLYGIALFLPSIIRGFGFSVPISNLLTVPPYAVATIVLLLFAHFADKLKLRWPFVLASQLLCVAGFSINISDASIRVKYFGTFLCAAGAYSGFPGILAWCGGNLAGQYKRSAALAIYIGLGNFAAAASSNLYRTRDAPKYKFGHGIELGFVGMGMAVLPFTVYAYKRINAQREALVKQGEESGGLKYTDEELRRMGDRAPEFRYGI
ncbi:MFS general substrate transporter [Thelephora ganbajun]|uniref:MFS general substrate transporter n=1 Tax=Thelephora ganbajun TaxID=370292 RepID=A0ACB6Z787_THEGA|nr:MFS general substrate transporter [Thelephora ganbajun]